MMNHIARLLRITAKVVQADSVYVVWRRIELQVTPVTAVMGVV